MSWKDKSLGFPIKKPLRVEQVLDSRRGKSECPEDSDFSLPAAYHPFFAGVLSQYILFLPVALKKKRY